MKNIQDEKLLQTTLQKYKLDKIVDLEKKPPFSLQYYDANEVILHEGTELESLLFLVDGKVKVTSSVATGKSLLLRFVQPFSIIGDIELIRNVSVQSQIKAVEKSLLIGLPRDYVRKTRIRSPFSECVRFSYTWDFKILTTSLLLPS
ncbi:DNA-binding transcriptional activator YeiL [Oceanobacillus picturae]|uniref:DNA-binding transcriptional activator YeiL n=1 Tax=Oceanobacillus picturae TaxID=171693 RepID=W9AKD9_9BACI|nr:cyclic nucleotide-binding domain-containing protein [Oceanobacillus picturae]CDO03382.1 DNA-binding transcriptional activator YeiL [Oceanobacillus picturae]